MRTDLEEVNEHTTPSTHWPKFKSWVLEKMRKSTDERFRTPVEVNHIMARTVATLRYEGGAEISHRVADTGRSTLQSRGFCQDTSGQLLSFIRSQWWSQHFMNHATTPQKWLQRSLIAHLPDTYICKWRRRLLCKCWSAYRMTKWVVKNAMKLWSHKAWIHSQNGITVRFHEYFRLQW